MAKITITLKAIPTHSYLSCDICAGQITDVSTVAEGQTEDGRRVTICDRCLLENDNGVSGLDGFDTILRNEIEKLESQAQFLRSLIGRLEVPTYADWFKVEWQRESDVEFPRNLRKAHASTDRGTHSLAATRNFKVEPASAD